MYDAVPACSKTISEQNTRTKNSSYHRLNGTIRQQNELLQQLKDEADHANVLIEERKISISNTEHNRERTFWMKEIVKKEAELEMINDEVKIAKKNAEL